MLNKLIKSKGVSFDLGKGNKIKVSVDPEEKKGSIDYKYTFESMDISQRISEGINDETWYFSSDDAVLDGLKPMYLVPNRQTAEMMGKHVHAFKIKQGSKWFDLGADEEMKRMLPYNLDTLGYLKNRWDDFTHRDIDVVWDIPDYKQGFEKIFVVNPKALEPVDMELGEISSMAGGAVQGYSLPLGAKKKKKKKTYMEPHMHQDEGKDPKKGTGKKPKGSKRRLYTDEDPSDTVSVKFSTVQDIKDTLSKSSFKSKSHKRQSQIINLIHQRSRAAYNNAKDPKVKSRLKKAYDYAKTRKEASKRKTQRMNKSK